MRYYQAFACAAAVVGPLCSSLFAECSLNTVRGIWGFQAHGTSMMTVGGSGTPVPVPYASLGIMTVDHQGRWTGWGRISIGGQVQNVEVAGLLQVAEDCSVINTYGGGLFEDLYVILDNGNEMQGMFPKHPLAPATGTAVFRRIARSQWDAGCRTDMLRGLYGGTNEGMVMMVPPGQSQPIPTPISGIVTGRFYGDGTGTAVSTASLAGNILNIQLPKLTVRVNPDCTVFSEWTATSEDLPTPISGTTMWVVLDGGKELLGLELTSTAGPTVRTENMKRISVVE